MDRKEFLSKSEREQWTIWQETRRSDRQKSHEIQGWLAEIYIPQLREVTRRIRRKYTNAARMDEEDVNQTVLLRFLEKMEEFNPNAGTTFMEWAMAPGSSWIIGCVIDRLRKSQFTRRASAKLLRQSETVKRRLHHQLRKPNLTEEDLRDHDIPIVSIPTFHTISEAHEESREAACSQDDQPVDMRDEILAFLRTIDYPHSQYFYEYWLGQQSQPNIASAYGVSVSVVNSSLNSTLLKLKSYLTQTGRWDSWRTWRAV